MTEKHSIAQIEAALRKADGRPAAAARILGISRQAMHERISRTPHLREVVSDIEQSLLDEAEGVIVRAIQAGDCATTRWYLDRRGQSRGYGKSVNVALDEAKIEAIIASLGGTADAYRAALRQLGVPASEIP